MLAEDNCTSRCTSWNGVSIDVPNSWEVVVTGVTHLQFETQFRPIFEIRWDKIPSRSSSDTANRSKKQIENLSGKKLRRITLPDLAEKLFPKFVKHGYTLDDKKHLEVLMLYCQSCSTFFLLQFFSINDDSLHPLHYVASLNCHDDISDVQPWSIQDFRVNIPISYRLAGYNLAAGFTKLSFLENKVILHICRIAPAAFRLHKQNFKDILATLAGLDNVDSIFTINETLLQYERNPSIGAQIVMRLQRKKPFCLATLRHDRLNDRLLGVIMEGIHPLTQQSFNTISNSYETLSTKKRD